MSLFRSLKNRTGVSNSSAGVIFAINTVRGANISLQRYSVIAFDSAIYDVTCEEVSRRQQSHCGSSGRVPQKYCGYIHRCGICCYLLSSPIVSSVALPLSDGELEGGPPCYLINPVLMVN